MHFLVSEKDSCKPIDRVSSQMRSQQLCSPQLLLLQLMMIFLLRICPRERQNLADICVLLKYYSNMVIGYFNWGYWSSLAFAVRKLSLCIEGFMYDKHCFCSI